MSAEADRVIQPTQTSNDHAFDSSLRPQTLADYIGQTTIKENLEIFLQAAKQRQEPIEHVLLHGGPGLGKTTLAHIIAKEMGVNIRITSGPAIERAGDLAAILTNLGQGDVLFIDEIHRLNKTIEEVLYPAMEDYALDVVIGKGPGARTLRLDLPKFTVIGATTRVSLLSSPLRDRFGAHYKLVFYSPEEMATIIERSARVLQVPVEPAAVTEIASRARSTPRIANRLLKRVRDFSQVKGGGSAITPAVAQAAMHMLDVDPLGLDTLDRKTIAATLGEDIDTLETVYEPFLLQIGFLARTPRGRVATQAAYEHLGVPPPTDLQSKLF
jgi:Holliday junction DNA helicase RuvB